MNGVIWKDSFITHRAFCDALAEESVIRLNSVTSPNLSFKSDSMNNSGQNIQAGFNQGLQDHAAGMSPFSSLFRPDFNSMAGGNPLNAGIPEMVQMATNNLFSSSPIPNFIMNNQFSHLDRSCTTPSASTPANLSLSSFGLKAEGGQISHNMVETLGSMFSQDHSNQNNQSSSSSSNPLSPMSATALLQKAAQMGSTRSNNSPFFGASTLGVMTSTSNSNAATINEAVHARRHHENISTTQGSPAAGLGSGNGSGTSGSNSLASLANLASSLATPVSDINQLIMHCGAKSQNDLNHRHMIRPNSNRVENDLTRDFLGIASGDGSDRQFSPQELANLASSMTSNIGSNHFGDK